jgi:hypothetical protein
VDAALPGRCHVEAWAPPVPGIAEVLHARMVDYAYPAHCHQTWAVLIVDDGAIRYDLDRRRCESAGQTVTLLPPGITHNGRPAIGARGFRKREILRSGALHPPLQAAHRHHPRPQRPQPLAASGLAQPARNRRNRSGEPRADR